MNNFNKKINLGSKEISYSIRRYFVDKFFFANIKLFSERTKILDIGGKKNKKRGKFNINLFNLDVKYVNIDKDAEPDFLCDAVSIPVEDNSYDGIILAEVLEHIYQPKTIIKEAFRILKPGGHLLITIPFMYPMHADPEDYNRFTETWFLKALEETGFEVLKIEYHGGFFAVLANNFRLLANDLNKISSLKKFQIKNYILKYWYLFLSNYYFIKDIKFNQRGRNNNFLEKFTTGFGVICRKNFYG